MGTFPPKENMSRFFCLIQMLLRMYIDVYCLESKIMYYTYYVCMLLQLYGCYYTCIHILYILRNIRNNIGVWVNRVRIMLLCLHSSIGEVLAIIINDVRYG